jgi:uncharacterized protein YndB with AHSA1/START domain
MMSKPSITITTPSDREIVIARVVNAGKALAYRAFTDPELLPLWCTGPDGWTMPVCDFPSTAPAPYRYLFKKGADGSEMEIKGTVNELSPPIG